MYIPDDINVIASKINSGDSWRLYIQQLMDDIRRDPSCYHSLLNEKPRFDDIKIFSIFQALTRHLGNIYNKKPPSWVYPCEYLKKPWFPSGIESLKATCIQESPFEFRRNNIFVLKNFTERI